MHALVLKHAHALLTPSLLLLVLLLRHLIMFPCSSAVELLCRLIRCLDAVAAAAAEPEASPALQIRLKEMKCKLERLQLKLIKEMFCKEDTAMQQLRHLASCLDELVAAACKDRQGISTLQSLDKVEAAVCRALDTMADKDLYTLCGKGNERTEGPWGPRLGFDWDIGSFGSIKTINVSADDRINSIRIEYRINSKEYKTPRIGGEGGTLHQIEIGENEHITSIRGIFDTISLTKLDIVTNKNSYSFGKGCGGSVFPPAQLECNYRVAGFFGRAAAHVNAIGVYLAKAPDCQQADDSPSKKHCPYLCQCGTLMSSCHVCA
ncbi:uncharacterized protein LOC122049348 isoform X1 [Zingiber officinale]|uniref:Jacalin-type lectin domain-containing protein n=2 Tax=Zingiber officinale TaxID=94328 RepID=A0A8J5HDQ5_ZINOF|nr:uncharacterized protein LOC122049348 isoform X1 [Zingiber officinale]KAG6525083.1 hypothetical protein ZIOFF_015035 [Zingiber officinale]